MGDWEAEMPPDEKQAWEEYKQHVKDELIPKLESSAVVVSVVPEKIDVKFATELGYAIMMNKPILAVALKGCTVPENLRAVAEHVAEIDDLRTPEGQQQMQDAISIMLDTYIKDDGDSGQQ